MVLDGRPFVVEWNKERRRTSSLVEGDPKNPLGIPLYHVGRAPESLVALFTRSHRACRKLSRFPRLFDLISTRLSLLSPRCTRRARSRWSDSLGHASDGSTSRTVDPSLDVLPTSLHARFYLAHAGKAACDAQQSDSRPLRDPCTPERELIGAST